MISEVDIQDMQELYKLNRGDHFQFAEDDLKTPPAAPEVHQETIYKFLKVDGMYAQVVPPEGPMAFVAAWTKVRRVNP